MNLGFKGRTLDSLTIKERRVVAARIWPFILFPTSGKHWHGLQAALSAQRLLKLREAETPDPVALSEEEDYFAAVGGLKQLIEAKSLTTYRKRHANSAKDIATVGFTGVFFNTAREVIGRDATRNLVFKYLATKGRIDGQKGKAPIPFHRNAPSAIKAAWKERQVSAPIIAAIMQLGLEKKIEFPPPKPEKLIADNFERFAGLLKWYAELFGRSRFN